MPISQFLLLRNRHFALLWVGQTVSQFGNSIFNIAIVWYVTDLTGSALYVANVVALGELSHILSTVFAGVIVDRFCRRMIMLASDLTRMLVVLAFAYFAYRQEIGIVHVYVLVVIFGLVGAFFAPAEMSFLPAVVSKEDLIVANSIAAASLNIVHITGPGVAGLLLAMPGIGVPGVSLINGASFLVGTLGIWLMRPVVTKRMPAEQKPFVKELIGGFEYLRSFPDLFRLISYFAFFNFVATPAFVLLPLFAKDALKVGVTGFGFMEVALCAGMLMGGVLAGVAGRRLKQTIYIFGMIIFQGLLLMALSISGGINAALIVLFVYGAVNAVLSTVFISVLQEKTGAEFHGRVFSLVSLISMGLQPVAAVASGILAEGFGISAVMILSGLSLAVMAAIGLLRGNVKNL